MTIKIYVWSTWNEVIHHTGSLTETFRVNLYGKGIKNTLTNAFSKIVASKSVKKDGCIGLQGGQGTDKNCKGRQ